MTREGAPPAEVDKHYLEACQYYEGAIEIAPSDERRIWTSASCIRRAETTSACVQTLQRGVKAGGDRPSVRLQSRLADALIRQGRLAEAASALDALDATLAKLTPQARAAWQHLADLPRAKLLVRQGEYAKAVPWVEDLMTGKDAAAHPGRRLTTPQEIYEAWGLLGQSHAGLKHWDQALAAYHQAAKLQPRDAAPLLAAAAVCAAADRRDENIRYCQEALTVVNAAKPVPEGQRQLIYEQLISLLDKAGRRAEADRYRSERQEQIAKSPQLTLGEVQSLVDKGRLDDALAAAQRCVQGCPEESLAHLALGRAWWAEGDNPKAAAALEKAAALAPDDVRASMVLFQFYADTRQTEHARQTLEKITHIAKLAEHPVERRLLAAECYAQLGDRRQAKAAYVQAVEAAKAAPPVQMRLVEFLLQGTDHDEAAEGEKLLRGLLTQYPPARLRLVELLVQRGGEQEWQEAQQLLESSPGGAASNTDRFLQAYSLLRRGGKENLDKAERLCQALLADAKQPAPTLRVLLAQIQESQGRPEQARQQYLALVDQDHPAPAHLASYVVFLLRCGPSKDVDRWLKKLETLAPEDLNTVQLRARWLRDQGRTAQIEPLVEGFAKKLLTRLGKEDVRQQTRAFQAVGDLYQRIGQSAAAERRYRRLIGLAPERYEPLALSLAGQGRIEEALALCQQAGKTDTSVRPDMTMAMVLLSERATAADLERAEPLLKKAQQKHKDNLQFLLRLAELRVVQERYDEAVELYRQILRQEPKQVAALNGLAAALAERPEPAKRQEALQCVDQAIKLIGLQPGLLDTKGRILLADGKPAEAAELLQQAAVGPRLDPRACFHLAVACDRLGQLDKARAALKQARQAELEHQVLTKTDRKLLAELGKKLGI